MFRVFVIFSLLYFLVGFYGFQAVKTAGKKFLVAIGLLGGLIAAWLLVFLIGWLFSERDDLRSLFSLSFGGDGECLDLFLDYFCWNVN